VVNEIRVLTDDFVTVPEAAKQIGKPKMTLYRWIDSEKIIAVTFGGIKFIPKSEVERLKLSSK
jgi:excisionase family DNA binding protein